MYSPFFVTIYVYSITIIGQGKSFNREHSDNRSGEEGLDHLLDKTNIVRLQVPLEINKNVDEREKKYHLDQHQRLIGSTLKEN